MRVVKPLLYPSSATTFSVTEIYSKGCFDFATKRTHCCHTVCRQCAKEICFPSFFFTDKLKSLVTFLFIPCEQDEIKDVQSKSFLEVYNSYPWANYGYVP